MSEPEPSPNAERIAWWKGTGADGWVAEEAIYDQMLSPVLAALLDHLDPQPGERILDVGAGTGTSTLAVAERVGPEGHVTAVDVSTPMLARAADGVQAAGLAGRVALVEADAQIHHFADDPFDAVTSRFGVMFFADPTAAFANLASATRTGGRLSFACWQPMERNPFLRVPMAAALSVLGPPDGPSPLGDPHSLGDPDLVASVLAAAGWNDVRLTPEEGELYLAGPGDLDHAVAFAVDRGTVRARLAGAAAEVVEAVREAMVAALSPTHDGTGARLSYAAWIVDARR